eukprot:6209095-Pleurochrysis_carterae.AAC.1
MHTALARIGMIFDMSALRDAALVLRMVSSSSKPHFEALRSFPTQRPAFFLDRSRFALSAPAAKKEDEAASNGSKHGRECAGNEWLRVCALAVEGSASGAAHLFNEPSHPAKDAKLEPRRDWEHARVLQVVGGDAGGGGDAPAAVAHGVEHKRRGELCWGSAPQVLLVGQYEQRQALQLGCGENRRVKLDCLLKRR